MTDQEILETYEPILCFHKRERFFPMNCEDYLSNCQLFKTRSCGRPLNITDHIGAPLAENIGQLKGSNFFLRYFDPVLERALWRVFSIIAVFSFGIGWHFWGWQGVRVAAWVAGFFTLIALLSPSESRKQVLSVLGVSYFFVWLISRLLLIQLDIPLWIIFCATPLFLAIVGSIFVTLACNLVDQVLPKIGVLLDFFSRATDEVANGAYKQYKSSLEEKDSKPTYYGMVNRYQTLKAHWTVVQYHFFYAFNDWRLAADGLNNHEGDWEMMAVFLKNDQPYGIGLSQHHAGAFIPWDQIQKIECPNHPHPAFHPVIYVALGSHANYPESREVDVHELFTPGRIQRFLYRLDRLLRKFSRIICRKQQEYARSTVPNPRKRSLDFKDSSLPSEHPTGDGVHIGCANRSPEATKDRDVTHPDSLAWEMKSLTPAPPWVHYKGLWGAMSPRIHALLPDESGPPGPKWERARGTYATPEMRLRWGKPLEWLNQLEQI